MIETPFGPFEQRPEPGMPQRLDVAAELAQRLPAFGEVVWHAKHEQMALVTLVVGDKPTHRAVRLLFNLAVSDFCDLLDDLGRGSGRSAVRTARAVIEHAVNMHSVVDDLSQASRYLEHLDQGPAILFELQPGAAQLEARVARSYRHSLKKVGADAKVRFDNAVQQHGSEFRRGWTPVDLKRRSELHGLEHLYPYYRLASLVVHGSAGGSLGTVRDDRDGFTTYRTGPALELAPVAMLAGIAAFREVLTGLQKARPDLAVTEFTACLDALASIWAEYFSAMREIDQALWPKERTVPPMAVLAFTRNRTRRWYLHIPAFGVLLPAEDPELSDATEAQVAGLIDYTIAEQSHLFRMDQRWVTACMTHVGVKAVAGAQAIPDTALLEVPPQDWEPQEVTVVGSD